MKHRQKILLLFVPVLAGLWYLFRPELLFVKTTVNESFPEATVQSTGGASAPAWRGAFHSVSHETVGTAEIHELKGAGACCVSPDSPRPTDPTSASTSWPPPTRWTARP